MELIGGAASITALVELTLQISKISAGIYADWKDAPRELEILIISLQSLEAEFETIKEILDATPRPWLTIRSHGAFADLLFQAEGCLRDLETIETRLQRHGVARMRLEWVMKHQSTVNRVVGRMDRLQQSISRWILLLTMKGNLSALEKTEQLRVTLVEPRRALSEQHVLPACACTGGQSPSTLERQARSLRSTPWSTGSNWSRVEIKGSLVPTKGTGFVDYDLAIQVKVPMAFLIGEYAISMSLSARTFPASPYKLTTRHPSSFGLARIVEEDNQFMTSCSRGDLLAVRWMLSNGEGRPTDITSKNWNPMTYAIISGSTDVVSELLNNGADVNGTFGSLQTTPLQWAIWQKQLGIVRLLLNRGASQDFINTIGWDTTFFCWPALKRDQGCMLDFLTLLADQSYQELETVDTMGWTTLHRVSAFGTAGEVKRLIELGAKPEQVALPLRWTALHHAVFYGNEATYAVLVSSYDDLEATSMTDERGWTLLHIAASAGHDTIVKDLLSRGADPEARSKPFMSHMPESLFGRACTPEEVAAAQSEEIEAQYLEALRECGLLDDQTKNAEDLEDECIEIWEEAVEVL